MNGSTSSRIHRQVFPATASSVHAARTFVTSVLITEPVSADSISTLRLVVSELVSNAVQHGNHDDGVEVAIDLMDDVWLRVVVTSGGEPPFAISDLAQWNIASPDAASGRGLGIVRSLADEVSCTAADGVVTVRCRVHR